MSSGQKFEGEDECAIERTKAQKKQMHDWMCQQMEEKKRKARQEKEEEIKYAEFLLQVNELRGEAEKELANERAERARALMEENKLLVFLFFFFF